MDVESGVHLPETSPPANDPPRHTGRDGRWFVAFGCFSAGAISLLFLIASGAVVLLLAGEADATKLPPATFMIAQNLLELLVLLVPALLLSRLSPIPFREQFRLRQTALFYYVVAAAGLLLLRPIMSFYIMVQELYLIPSSLLPYFRSMEQDLTDSLRPILLADGPLLALAVLTITVTPAICEEMVFRGLVQRNFEERLRPAMAAILAGVLFSALHMQPTNVIPLAAVGSFLGYVAWSGQSIYPVIAGHLIFNATSLIAARLAPEELLEPTDATPDELLALLPFALLSAAGLAWLIVRLRRR